MVMGIIGSGEEEQLLMRTGSLQMGDGVGPHAGQTE